MPTAVRAEMELYKASWTALGCQVELLVTERAQLAPARRAVAEVLDEVDQTFSRFRDDSELSILNRSSARSVRVSPLLARALRVAIDAADWSDGLVDPTMGQHLLDLGYDRSFSAVPTTGPALASRELPTTTFRSLELDGYDGGGSSLGDVVLRRPPGVRLDLGATGKGLAADLAAEAAVVADDGGVLVNLGGDISVAGVAPEGGWPVFVTDDSRTSPTTGPSPDRRSGASIDPCGQGVAGQTVALLGGALATSGTSRRRWRRGGADIHHIIDPTTGLSAVSPWRTVSVVAPTCVLANAAATAGIILGSAASGWLSATGLAARLVAVDGDVVRIGSWPA